MTRTSEPIRVAVVAAALVAAAVLRVAPAAAAPPAAAAAPAPPPVGTTPLSPPPVAAPPPAPAAAAQRYQVSALSFEGLRRTDDDWLRSYVDYELPATLTAVDAEALRKRLLTTAVFSDVAISFVQDPPPAATYTMHIAVTERWTTIPVVRAAFGGGTPLKVLGIYDIHAFGRLVTLGVEGQQYGNAPVGTVFFAKSPRHSAGRYFIGAEMWREFRRRTIYDDDVEELGAISGDTAMTRFTFLTALLPVEGALTSYPWRAGIDVTQINEHPARFTPVKDAPTAPPGDLGSMRHTTSVLRFLPTVQYDDVDLNIIDMDGFRASVKGGPVYVGEAAPDSPSSWQSLFESEAFYYKLWPAGFNLATHLLVGSSSYHSLRHTYFLGGLDSVRGFPDGVVYGTRAAWANAELRHLTWKATPYTWFQTVAFCDAGAAANDWNTLHDRVHASCGTGLRLAVPQVNRMIFRLDYAWAVDGSGMKGIAAGMNQFFDPYKPLSER